MPKKSYSFEVVQKVTSITISGNATTVVPNNAIQLTATVNPSNANNKAVTWTTNAGHVSQAGGFSAVGVAAGTELTVWATAQDGSGVKGTYIIKVVAPTTTTKPTTTTTKPKQTTTTKPPVTPTQPPNPPASGAGFVWPTEVHFVTSPWGMRNGKMHNGDDIRTTPGSEVGKEVYAARGGSVYDTTTWTGGGRTIVLQHDKGYKTIYMHLKSYNKHKGDDVTQGVKIAQSGSSTANSRGGAAIDGHYSPHLHFEICTDYPSNNTKRITISPTEGDNPVFIKSGDKFVFNPNFKW